MNRLSNFLVHPVTVFVIAYTMGYAMGVDINYMECVTDTDSAETTTKDHQ